MKNKFSLILLLIFLFSNTLFAQSGPKISDSLLKKASQTQTALKARTEEKISVLFFPEGDNSENIDLSFFDARGIEYIKSRNFLSADIPVGTVAMLDRVKGARYIALNVKAKALETVSEGRDAVNASVYVYENIDGTGIKIAVIDVGFKSYNYLQASGELPKNIITKDFTKNGAPEINAAGEYEPHGTSCAEIIYDFAPGAQMYLLKVIDAASIQNAFDYCKAQRIRIASSSIGFSYGFWCDGTGIFAKMATEAYNNGILPVFAAGNEGEESWFGKFNGNSEDFMIFPSGKDYLELYMYAYGNVYMMWDDFKDKNKKYTLYMYDNTGNILIDYSEWGAGDDPSVFAANNSSSGYVRLKIKKENAYDDVNIRLYFDGYYRNNSDKVTESSLSSPGDCRQALTVGAMRASSWGSGPIDSYSSRGPTRATADLAQAQKPDITGPSYVTTVSYGMRGFNGTSSATPHIAGSAALILSLDRTMSAGQLKDKVLSYHKQIGSSPDNNYGMGKLVLGTDMIPGNSSLGDIICFPNPSSISKTGYIKITNLPYNTSMININVYTVTGEFVKSFDASDLKSQNGRMTIQWNLKNQNGSQIAPGVYFVTVDTPLNKKKVKKIAIQK